MEDAWDAACLFGWLFVHDRFFFVKKYKIGRDGRKEAKGIWNKQKVSSRSVVCRMEVITCQLPSC